MQDVARSTFSGIFAVLGDDSARLDFWQTCLIRHIDTKMLHMLDARITPEDCVDSVRAMMKSHMVVGCNECFRK